MFHCVEFLTAKLFRSCFSIQIINSTKETTSNRSTITRNVLFTSILQLDVHLWSNCWKITKLLIRINARQVNYDKNVSHLQYLSRMAYNNNSHYETWKKWNWIAENKSHKNYLDKFQIFETKIHELKIFLKFGIRIEP